MTLQEARVRLLKAITRATNEHGWPNTFSFGELAEYGGLSPTLAGRVFESVRETWQAAHPSCRMARTSGGRVSIVLKRGDPHQALTGRMG
jgi:hypothetical protein